MMNRVILDIDSVGDDILAVIFGVLDPHTHLEAITTVCGASGDIEQATWVALNTVALTHRNISVYAGMAQPMKPVSTEHGDPVNFHELLRDKLGSRLDRFNEAQTKPLQEAEVMNAVDYIIDTVKNNPNEITIVTTGPMTNLGVALQKCPEIASKIKQVIALGGNFQIAGNITPLSEYNIWADPEAAKIVLNADIDDITLVPLDICENNDFAASMLSRDDLYDLETYGKRNDVIEYMIHKFPVYIDIWREFFDLSGFPMDDIITLALVAHPHLCTYSDPVHVDVELEGSLARGATVAYFGKQIMYNPLKEHRNVRIAQSVDGRAFMKLFVDTIIDDSHL